MFQTLKYNITINAPKEILWNVLFTDENYPKWVDVFCEGSFAKTDWQKGSDVEFLTPSGEGMFSIIAEKEENKLLVFKHLGMLNDGKRMFDDEKSKEWNGAKESYQLIETNGKTELKVSMDTTEEYVDYFNKTFPKALKKIKALAEMN